MRIKQIINRSLLTICAVLGRRKAPHRRQTLIVFQQAFGDAVLAAQTLQILSKEIDGDVLILANPSIVKFLDEVMEWDKTCPIQAVDFKRFVSDYAYYRSILQTYADADTIIVPGTSLSAELFATASKAPRRIGLVRSVPVKWPPAMALFSRLAYTEKVVPPQDLMMLQRHRMLLQYLGVTDYRATLPHLKPQPRCVQDAHYCVMCPGASIMEKCWPTERYVQIMDFIIEQYNMDIYLSGGADETHFEPLIFSMAKYPDRIHSRIGKTTFSEWSSLVQHADLVVGNDSATMHLAAASDRKAVCVAGVYDKFQFFPYKVDYLAEGRRLPVTVLHDKPCAWCRSRGYYSGYQNKPCRDAIRAGKCALCIEEITVEEVKTAIQTLMEEA